MFKFFIIIITFLSLIISCKAQTVSDVDGNIYNTIIIGNQIWMAENLKTTHFKDTTDIILSPDYTVWSTLTTPAFCWINNDWAAYGNTYGALYNWYAVNSQKLAPEGWHVPTFTEWVTMENYLISNGYNYDETSWGNNETNNKIAKSLGAIIYWDTSYVTGSVGNVDFPGKRNASGFSALPGSFRDENGYFGTSSASIARGGFWWTSSQHSTVNAYNLNMYYNESIFPASNANKRSGLSVRCVRDADTITGFKELEDIEEFHINIFPNPASSQLHGSFESAIPEMFLIEILDLHGKVVSSQSIDSQMGVNNFLFLVESFPSGLYLVRVQSSKKMETIKFIIK